MPRNKELLDILRHFDYAESTGHGVPEIIKAYGKSAFRVTANYINITLPYDKEVIDSRLAKFKQVNEGINEERNDGRNEERKLTELELVILTEIQKNPKVTMKNIIKMTNKSRPTIERAIKRLVEIGAIKRDGSTKAGCWIIV